MTTAQELRLTDGQKTALSIARDYKYVRKDKGVAPVATMPLNKQRGNETIKTAAFNKLVEFGLIALVPESDGKTYKVSTAGYKAYTLSLSDDGSHRWSNLKILIKAGQVTDEQALEYIRIIDKDTGYGIGVPPQWWVDMEFERKVIQNRVLVEANTTPARDSMEIVNLNDKSTARLLWTAAPALKAFKQIVKEIYGYRVHLFDGDNQDSSSSEINLRFEKLNGSAEEFDIKEIEKQFDNWIRRNTVPVPSSRAYDNLNEDQKKAVDGAWQWVGNVFRANNFKAANNDHAEHLVDAITTYLLESNK